MNLPRGKPLGIKERGFGQMWRAASSITTRAAVSRAPSGAASSKTGRFASRWTAAAGQSKISSSSGYGARSNTTRSTSRSTSRSSTPTPSWTRFAGSTTLLPPSTSMLDPALKLNQGRGRLRLALRTSPAIFILIFSDPLPNRWVPLNNDARFGPSL